MLTRACSHFRLRVTLARLLVFPYSRNFQERRRLLDVYSLTGTQTYTTFYLKGHFPNMNKGAYSCVRVCFLNVDHTFEISISTSTKILTITTCTCAVGVKSLSVETGWRLVEFLRLCFCSFHTSSHL